MCWAVGSLHLPRAHSQPDSLGASGLVAHFLPSHFMLSVCKLSAGAPPGQTAHSCLQKPPVQDPGHGVHGTEGVHET